ncbi:hypothetical protein ScPMuIL_002967 [Solemya velum]
MAYLLAGDRGGKVLIYNFRYHKNKKTAAKIHWRCWRKECRTPLQSNLFAENEEDPNIQIIQSEDHNHGGEKELISRSVLVQRMRDSIRTDPTRPIKRVYNEVLTQAARNVPVEDTPEFRNVQSALKRTRLSLMPEIPDTINDVDINGEWATTWAGRRFLSHLDNAWGVCVFATDKNLQSLIRCETVFIDGTFKTCPDPYEQFVTIHGLYHGRVLPFVLALVTGKTVGHYRQILQHVKARVRNLTGHRFAPNMAITDFEHSLRIAIDTELRRTRVRSCYFHFCQNLWRHVQSLGLARSYTRYRNLKLCIQKVMAIAYLPVAIVRQNFRLLLAARRTRRLINRFPALRDFLAYFQRNYLDGQFHIPEWNLYERNVETRTNNHVEGFHHKWNSSVERTHPSLWVFIRKLKDEQRETEISAAAALRGDPPRPRRRKYRDMEHRILRLKEEYANGRRNVEEYWNAIRHVVRTFF